MGGGRVFPHLAAEKMLLAAARAIKSLRLQAASARAQAQEDESRCWPARSARIMESGEKKDARARPRELSRESRGSGGRAEKMPVVGALVTQRRGLPATYARLIAGLRKLISIL